MENNTITMKKLKTELSASLNMLDGFCFNGRICTGWRQVNETVIEFKYSNGGGSERIKLDEIDRIGTAWIFDKRNGFNLPYVNVITKQVNIVTGTSPEKERNPTMTSYTVKKWFANKIANEVRSNISMCDVFCILRETEKAVYAVMNLGTNFSRTMWVPKSVLVEFPVGTDDNGIYHRETLYISDYNEAMSRFAAMWSDFT